MALSTGVGEWVCERAPKVRDWEQFIAETMKKFGMERKRVRDVITKLRARGKIPQDALVPAAGTSKPVVPAVKRNGKSFRMSVDLSEIAGEYDEEAKIRNGLENLGTRLIKDNDFRVELGVPIDRWKVVSNMAKFANNKRELKGKRFRGIYWGTSEVIKELSKKIDIL